MNSELLNRIKLLKNEYQKEGIILIGVFGSYARGDHTSDSDIDILFELTENFYKKYPGWGAYPVIDKCQESLTNLLGKKVDLANKNALNEIGKKYILPELINV